MTTQSAAPSTAKKIVTAPVSTLQRLAAGPDNPTAWDALKAVGFETLGIVALAVVAALSSSAGSAAIAFLVLLWLLALIAPPTT